MGTCDQFLRWKSNRRRTDLASSVTAISLLCVLPLAASAMSVTLVSSVASPERLGTPIVFQAAPSNADGADLTYRFRTRHIEPRTGRNRADTYRTVVDYGPKSSFEWTTIAEGAYEIEVSALDSTSGAAARAVVQFEFLPLAGASPVITPTVHPLVFVYSAPACPYGLRMRVQFEADGVPPTQTPYKECDGRHTMNFYLAGIRPAMTYHATHRLELAQSIVIGPEIIFHTSAVSESMPIGAPMSTPVPEYRGVLLQSVVNGRSVATDLNGNVIWYGPSGLSLLTRVGADGSFLGIYEDGAQRSDQQIFREFDLAGVTVAETNARRISDQLTAQGLRPITSFHHEAIRLANGRYLLLAGSERVIPAADGQGSVAILGDTILVLDPNLQLLWAWDSFDHLDTNRPAILGESCAYPASLACSTFYGAAKAQDWLHGNALQLTPDGNILYSARHQDWVVKIDYQNGSGSGQVLWKLGAGGDFVLADNDASLWFSHQHDAHFLADGVSLLLFDNGNTRIARNADQGISRGQLWRLDADTHVAKLLLNVDLGVNSPALGTAQLLPNGHYHFDAGFVSDPQRPAQRITRALEVDPQGNIIWGMQIAAQQYRSFRLTDLYSPPDP